MFQTRATKILGVIVAFIAALVGVQLIGALIYSVTYFLAHR